MSERTDLGVDSVLADRYRLLRPVTRHRVSTLWRGVDEVLARPVAIRTLDRPEAVDGAESAFLDAAVLAGRLAHPRIASIYDAASADGLPYVVSEWVEGGSLADLLALEPLTPPRATTVTAQVAEAMAHAHAHGVAHLDLDVRNVLLGADGSAKVTDFCLGALLRAAADGTPQPALDPTRGIDPDDEAADVRALGALLYACLTARSATTLDTALPAAPRRNGRLLSPRQVRAGVPRELDRLVSRVLPGGAPNGAASITSAAGLLAALAPLPGSAEDARPTPVGAPARPPLPRWLRWGVPALVMVTLAVGSLALGYSIGELPRPPGAISPLEAPASAVPEAPEEGALSAARIASVVAFDPAPGDGQERNQTVPLATDGDASTAWETVRYRTADFGRLKTGVGLLFDLGAPVKVSRVELAVAQTGISVQLRAANARGDAADDYAVVASAADTKERVTLRPSAGTAASRYWLVWVTKLVKVEDERFQAGIAEVAFGR